jgi:DNA invertase Pin-like site-specific DNA recombinase
LSTIQQINTMAICRRARPLHTYNTAPGTAARVAKQVGRHPEILELASTGMPRAEIARRLGLSIRTVSRVKVAAGMGHPGFGATEDEKLRAKALLEDGASYAEVGRTIGFHQQHIKRWFPGYEWTIEQRNEMAEMQRRMDALTWIRGVRCDKRKRPWDAMERRTGKNY